ncbi:VPLPA-CTERM sorting domain-containing protein [Rhodobaculum claviforme]|nr:VPLPA-CTERM sorting domain-containing protein [Rhodobaculum claviforme]
MSDVSRSGWATVSVAALMALAVPSPAVACTPGTDGGVATLTCDGVRTEQLVDDVDGTVVTVTPSGSVVVPSANALDLRGNGQTLVNLGQVEGGGDSDAVRASGSDLTVENSGTLTGTDRGIRLVGGTGGFTLRNHEDGQILARRQAVRLDNDALLAGNLFENRGLIESTEGRAIQSRGPGNTVINHATGRMLGGEEVIEGRMDFHVTNYGLIALRGLEWDPDTFTWTDNGATVDEDGIQFASGSVHNHGVILATDDGVDIDEGTVHNHATGVIVSAGVDTERNAAGIDIDEVLQDPGGPRDGEIPRKVTIMNDGYIEGPRAIAAAEGAVHPIDILNTGTLIGRGGTAIDLAPGQGDTTITLSDGSVIDGDILFGGGGTNTLVLGPFSEGAGMNGSISARGGTPEDIAAGTGTPYGFDVVFGDMVGLGDFRSFWRGGERFTLNLAAGGGTIGFTLFGVEDVRFGGTSYSADGFAAFLAGEGVNVIPLPAAGWLLLGGLGTLAALRRRRRAA